MPVLLSSPLAQDLLPVKGIRIGTAEAGIRKANRQDLTLIEVSAASSVAGVFTTNRFCAAPVTVCQNHLKQNDIRALIINTGIANAGTGQQGLDAAHESCRAVGELLNIPPTSVLPFSTGVILEHLPVDRLCAGLPTVKAHLDENNWYAAAHAIMTTDTVAKAHSIQIQLKGRTVTLTGIAKGAGMIKPNMATMLGFIATDAVISPNLLQNLLKEVADASFNSITVDGDTSTNDSFILIATGQAGHPPITQKDEPDCAVFYQAVLRLAQWLAQAIVRDGEGATKFITLQIEGGKTREECRKVGYAIGHSPLVKTAFFASDPNLGRILAAVGYAGIEDLDTSQLKVWLSANGEEALVAEHGGRAQSYKEETGARIMKAPEITVRVNLARGTVASTLWTCDFSYDYVKINADYRS